jgi:hypothetical protein
MITWGAWAVCICQGQLEQLTPTSKLSKAEPFTTVDASGTSGLYPGGTLVTEVNVGHFAFRSKLEGNTLGHLSRRHGKRYTQGSWDGHETSLTPTSTSTEMVHDMNTSYGDGHQCS